MFSKQSLELIFALATKVTVSASQPDSVQVCAAVQQLLKELASVSQLSGVGNGSNGSHLQESEVKVMEEVVNPSTTQ